MSVHGLRASSRRAGFIAVSLFLPLAVGTAGAHAACNDPELQISRETAKAGDKVAFSISDTTPGTEYLLKVAESELNAGTATGSSVTDTFKMPDLGANGRGANVVAILDNEQCENGPWKLVQAMTYAVPAASKPAQQKQNAGPAPGANKQLANFKAQRAKERQAALKREKALKKALKKRQAAAKHRAKLQKKQARQAKQRQQRQRAKRKKAFEKALLARQKAQKEKAKEAQAKQPKGSGDKTAQDRPRGDGDSSKAFIALGLLYTLIGGLGGGGFLLYRRSGRGIPMSKREADAAAAPPPIPEFGETTGATAVRPGVPALGADELDAEPKAPEPDDFDSLAPAAARRNGPSAASEKAAVDGAAETLPDNETEAASDKDKLEAELRRLLTDAGIDAELDGIVADAQAEAERRGVPMDADLMMQLLTGGGDSSASELKAKLQEIVAEEKERLALRHHDG
jgi:hypothetical protein